MLAEKSELEMKKLRSSQVLSKVCMVKIKLASYYEAFNNFLII